MNNLKILKQIQYISHLLLNSKYKFLITLIIYLTIIDTYNLSMDNYNIVECMKENSTDSTSPRSPEVEYVNYLESEAWRMDRRISELEEELQNYKYKDQVVGRVTQIEKDVEQIKNSINTINERLDNLENTESRSDYNLPLCTIL